MRSLKIKQLGIGLLELMLSLAIIATLLIAVLGYYQSTRMSQQANAAIKQLGFIVGASEDWLFTKKTFTGISLKALVERGKLPKEFCPDLAATTCDNKINPWGGTIKVVSVDSGSKVKITMNKLPYADNKGICIQILDLMKHRLDGDCTELSEYVGIYPK